MPEAEGYLGLGRQDKIGEKYEEELCKDLIRQFEQLKSDRSTWESHWQEIAERVIPMHKNLFLNYGTISTQGEKRNQEILDSTAMLALERFAAILDSLLTPRNQFWHQLKPSDRSLLRDKQVADWFSQVNTILFEQRYAPTANFAAQNQSVYSSLGAYGTGGLFIDPLDPYMGPGFRYKYIHLSELFVQENHQGIIDRVCRYFSLTARQAVQKFGKNCPEIIQEKFKTHPESTYFFLQWVIPRQDRDPVRKDFKGMEFASYYISMEAKRIIGEGGYRVFPLAISRYYQSPGESYGRSPIMNALPAIKTLNKQKETILKQGQMVTDPVMLTADDGIMDGAQVEPGTYISGAVNAQGQLLVHPLPTGRVDIGKDLMDDERMLINDTMLVRFFQILLETPEMTATEVIERTREKGILLAPTVGRQQSEYLGPMVNREIDLAIDLRLLPPKPPLLVEAGSDYTIVYDSPITRTQKADWASGAVRSIELLTNVAHQMQDPSKLFYINWDVAAPQIMEIYGTPSPWINTPDKVRALQAQFAKQQQLQAAIQAAPAAAGMLKATQ